MATKRKKSSKAKAAKKVVAVKQVAPKKVALNIAPNLPAERRKIRNDFTTQIKGESNAVKRNDLRREMRRTLKSLTV